MYFPDRRAYEADVRDFLRAADDFRSSFQQQQQHQRQQHAPAPPSRSRRQLPPAPASIPQYPYDDDVTHPKTFYEPQQHSRDEGFVSVQDQEEQVPIVCYNSKNTSLVPHYNFYSRMLSVNLCHFGLQPFCF